LDENRVVTSYRKYAKNYDFAVKLYRLLGLDIDKFRKMAIDALELSRGDTVVELGCGTGLNFARVINAIGTEGKLIGVDITNKMLEMARKKVKENGWKNIELIHSDFTDYQFPNELDGIFATGAIQYSSHFDKIIENGYNALQTGKKFVIVDGKIPQGPARIFASILLNFTKPFGADKEYFKRQAWKSIEKHFEKTTFQEGWGGFLYMSVGTKT